MRTSGSFITASTWVKSHRILLLTLFLSVLLIALVGWYYANATRQAFQTAPTQAEQALPTAPTTVKLDTSVNTASVQSSIKSNSTPPITTQVQVNGQPIKTPQTGKIHKVVPGPNGSTTVDISVANSTSGNTSTSADSSTNIELNSSSQVSSSNESSQ